MLRKVVFQMSLLVSGGEVDRELSGLDINIERMTNRSANSQSQPVYIEFRMKIDGGYIEGQNERRDEQRIGEREFD